VSTLVIANRESPARESVERLTKWSGPDRQEPAAAKGTIRLDSMFDINVAILVNDPDTRTLRVSSLQDWCAAVV